uniref:PDZ domain-containing protein n=1 Tax=Macrostomum lignano TaxID=282301 RepID=A0A1I8FC56_9PLAT
MENSASCRPMGRRASVCDMDRRGSRKKPAAPSSPPLPPPDSSVGAFEVVLRRLAGQGFGFSIAGGVDEPHQPGDSRLFVTKVAPGGVAESDGRMSVGDVILAVNGVDVTSVSHEAAVSALKMSGAQLSLLMLRPPPQPQPALKPTAEAAPLPAEPPTARGLGFSIAGGTDNQHLPGDDSIFVTKVIDGGAAQHSGRIGFGDRLLAEAVATLKATGDRVRLTVGKATPEEVALLIELDEAARLEEQEAEAAAAVSGFQGPPDAPEQQQEVQRTRRPPCSFIPSSAPGGAVTDCMADWLAGFGFNQAAQMKQRGCCSSAIGYNFNPVRSAMRGNYSRRGRLMRRTTHTRTGPALVPIAVGFSTSRPAAGVAVSASVCRGLRARALHRLRTMRKRSGDSAPHSNLPVLLSALLSSSSAPLAQRAAAFDSRDRGSVDCVSGGTRCRLLERPHLDGELNG